MLFQGLPCFSNYFYEFLCNAENCEVKSDEKRPVVNRIMENKSWSYVANFFGIWFLRFYAETKLTK